MGLIVNNFQFGGASFKDCYAKVDDITYDNNSKVAYFKIAFYPTQGSDNLITKISDCATKVIGNDIIGSCYNNINTVISSYKNRATVMLDSVVLLDGSDPERIRAEERAWILQKMSIIQLENATISL